MSLNDGPIVLIHGLFGSLSDARIVGAFGDVRVLAPDMIGYGAFREADLSDLTLTDQADHVGAQLDARAITHCHLVGHSVGGAVAMLLAARRPEIVASVTSVEGNFTLNDAFWSQTVAGLPLCEVEELLQGYRANPATWFTGAGVSMTPWTQSLAQAWLDNQPAATIKAQAAAVVDATRPASYLDGVRRLMASATPVNLIAGARSAAGWDVPDWAGALCDVRVNIPGVGHLMMAESPERFARTVLACLRLSEPLLP